MEFVLLGSIITALNYLLKDYILDISYIKYWFIMLLSHYVIGEFIHLFDYLPFLHKYKMVPNSKSQVTTVSTLNLYKNTLVNLLQFVPVLYLYKTYYIDSNLIYKYSNIYITLFELALNSISFLLVFDAGHYVLHLKSFYKYHKKHHTTYADRAITASYMSKVDYILEVITPFMAGPLLFKTSYFSFIIWSNIALVTSLINHSGYDFKYINGREHYNHHINSIKH